MDISGLTIPSCIAFYSVSAFTFIAHLVNIISGGGKNV